MSEVTEDKILIRMQDASKELQTLLNKLLVIRQEIDVSLNALDNNYFVEKTDALENFIEIFNINFQGNLLEEYNTQPLYFGCHNPDAKVALHRCLTQLKIN